MYFQVLKKALSFGKVIPKSSKFPQLLNIFECHYDNYDSIKIIIQSDSCPLKLQECIQKSHAYLMVTLIR